MGRSGIVTFYIMEIPRNFGHSLRAFVVWRSDGSQVPIQPRTGQQALLQYTDRPGTQYQESLACHASWTCFMAAWLLTVSLDEGRVPPVPPVPPLPCVPPVPFVPVLGG